MRRLFVAKTFLGTLSGANQVSFYENDFVYLLLFVARVATVHPPEFCIRRYCCTMKRLKLKCFKELREYFRDSGQIMSCFRRSKIVDWLGGVNVGDVPLVSRFDQSEIRRLSGVCVSSV